MSGGFCPGDFVQEGLRPGFPACLSYKATFTLIRVRVLVPVWYVIRTSEARTCASFTESRSLVHAHTRNSVAGENCEITLKVECLAKVYPANAGIMLRVAVFDKIASYMPMSHVL